MKFYLDFFVTLCSTEVIEAADSDEAARIVAQLEDSDKFGERLIENWSTFPIMTENLEQVGLIEADDNAEVTLTAEDIASYAE